MARSAPVERVAFVALHPPGEGAALPRSDFPNFGARRVDAAIVDAMPASVETLFFEGKQDERQAVLDGLIHAAPDVLAVSAYMWSLPALLDITRKFKQAHPNTRIIFGGPQAHPNVLRQEMYREPATLIDAMVIEEPEQTFVRLMRTLQDGGDVADVPGLALREGDAWKKTEVWGPDRRADLNHLASPWQMGRMPRGAYAYLERFRGCPLSCTFCEWGRLDDPKAVMTQARIEAELNAYREGGASGVLLVDAGLNLHAQAFENFAAAERNVGLLRELPLIAEVYPRKVNDALMRFLDDQCAPHIGLGLQTFNPSALDAVDRRFVEQDFEPLVHRLSEVCSVAVEIILGLPGDSPESFRRTLERLMALPCRVRVYPCVVLPTALMSREGAAALSFDPATSKMTSCPGWPPGAIEAWSAALDEWAPASGGIADLYWWKIPDPASRTEAGDTLPTPTW